MALRETSRTFGVAMALALVLVLTLLIVQYGSLSFAAEVFGLLQPLAIALTGTLLFSIPVASFVLPGLAGSLAGRAGKLESDALG